MILRCIFAFFALSSVADSCSCIKFNACLSPGTNRAPLFLGTVLEVVDLPATSEEKFLTRRKARIRVDESFGGLPADLREVDIFTGQGASDCGIAFKSGEVYLLSAFIANDGLMRASSCGDTRRMDTITVSLNVLRQLHGDQNRAFLTGRIVRQDRDFTGSTATSTGIPLPGALVRVKGEGRVYETYADGQGYYSFHTLPPGQYEFAPELPPGTTLASQLGSADPPRPIAVTAGYCADQNVDVYPSGSIQGQVLDSDNHPLASATVYIFRLFRRICG